LVHLINIRTVLILRCKWTIWIYLSR